MFLLMKLQSCTVGNLAYFMGSAQGVCIYVSANLHILFPEVLDPRNACTVAPEVNYEDRRPSSQEMT